MMASPSGQPPRSHPRVRILVALILAAAMVLGARHLTPVHLWGDDFAAYILQARAVSTGAMAAEVDSSRFTVEHSSSVGWPVAYPWGFPLLLAPAMAGTPGIRTLKLPGLLAFGGFLLAFAALMLRRLPPAEAVLVVAALGINPGLLAFLDQVLSDIPFLCLATAAFLVMDAPRSGERSRVGPAVGLGLIIAAAWLVRTVGVLLLGAWLLHGAWLVWERRADRAGRWRHVPELAITTATVLLVVLTAGLMLPDSGEGGYGALLPGISFASVTRNLVEYARLFEEFFATIPRASLLYLLFVPAIVAGLWRHDRLDRPLLVHAALTLAVLVTWPFTQGPRFLYPLFPLFPYLAMRGMLHGVAALPPRWRQLGCRGVRGLWLALVAVFLIQATRRAGLNVGVGPADGPYHPASAEMFEFLRERTDPESVVVFFKPRVARLLTGRMAIRATDCEVLSSGQTLVLAKGGTPFQPSPATLDACPVQLERRFENAGFVVYRVESL